MSTLYCLYCQEENKLSASHCHHCGARLIPKDVELASELDKQQQADGRPSDLAVAHCLRRLPLGGIALFFVSQTEPLLVPQLEKLVLGRKQEVTTEQVLDLSAYGRLAHSISRRHALISQHNNSYSLSDLGSTNGTWLNQQLLQPGKNYPLQNLDLVRLGLFSFRICFHAQAEPMRTVRLYMQGHNTLMPGQHLLSSPYLLQKIAPYLYALNELHQVLALGQQQAANDLKLYRIQEEFEGIVVQMEMDEALQTLLQQHIFPWRAAHADHLGVEASSQKPSTVLESHLQTFAAELLGTYAPTAVNDKALRQRLAQALYTVVCSRLEPTIRPQ